MLTAATGSPSPILSTCSSPKPFARPASSPSRIRQSARGSGSGAMAPPAIAAAAAASQSSSNTSPSSSSAGGVPSHTTVTPSPLSPARRARSHSRGARDLGDASAKVEDAMSPGKRLKTGHDASSINSAATTSTTGSAGPSRGNAEPERPETMQRDRDEKRAQGPAEYRMPALYSNCQSVKLGACIAEMLSELIRINDRFPPKEGQLTRFHSRAPPDISVSNYLNRLVVHATLTPPILLCMVYYIDRLCSLYPAFMINSLTVHRYLITSATVACKGLSDSFWTNNTYARVGGISPRELASLEMELLSRLEWRIVPRPEVLEDYYRSLVGNSKMYWLEDDRAETDRIEPQTTDPSTGPSNMIAASGDPAK